MENFQSFGVEGEIPRKNKRRNQQRKEKPPNKPLALKFTGLTSFDGVSPPSQSCPETHRKGRPQDPFHRFHQIRVQEQRSTVSPIFIHQKIRLARDYALYMNSVHQHK
ncbi:unnamed protein product, partial [Ilex paraguariensis]